MSISRRTIRALLFFVGIFVGYLGTHLAVQAADSPIPSSGLAHIASGALASACVPEKGGGEEIYFISCGGIY